MRPLALVLTFIWCSLPTVAHGANPIGPLLEASSAVKLVAEYLGVIDSLDSKIDRLLDADHKTAVSLFEQAKQNPKKADQLISEARICFTRAAAINADSMDEQHRNKRALALLGLWACCVAADDEPNAKLALEKITDISSDPSPGMEIKYRTIQLISDELIPFGALRSLFRKPPSTHDWRKFSEDYDSLLTIREAVTKKLKPK